MKKKDDSKYKIKVIFFALIGIFVGIKLADLIFPILIDFKENLYK
ncbi:TPA: hypothetical protein QFC14_002536 [Enterococcus faecium]